ncbi:MAG: HIT family hydrolase [Bdellovibrionales bacterium RBG_16_40_8]|nr:MAG: HIT family hydrolase [Bdellovibrionales bacterium RBG_16_40_8]
MLRPDRLPYLRKIYKTDCCVFCSARDQGEEFSSLCIHKNEQAMLVLNKYPYNSGHVMVLPTRHCGDLLELSTIEYTELQKLLRKAISIVKSEYRVQGMNIGLNMGSIAGAGIPEHLHWHVIPRWHGDTNFFPLIAETKVISESLEVVYERYAKHFK